MENTFVNFGGHKITTNKVGTVGEIALNSAYVSSSYKLYYCVTNGICVATVYLNNLKVMSGLTTIIATGLPPPKMTITQAYPNPTAGGVVNTRIANSGGTGVLMAGNGTQTSVYCTWVYPVADDWVES